jgi:hypothetical protein
MHSNLMMASAEMHLPVGLMEQSESVMKNVEYWLGTPVYLLGCRTVKTEPNCQPGLCDLLVPIDQVQPVTMLVQPHAPCIKRIHD